MEDWATAVAHYRRVDAANERTRRYGRDPAELYPEGEVCNMMGVSLRKMGDAQGALEAFHRGLQVAPDR